MTTAQVEIDRKAAEAKAKQRAAMLVEGLDLYAYVHFVMCRTTDVDGKPISLPVFACESHWDAVLVLLAYGKR